MKVVLIDPAIPWPRGSKPRWTPLGLAYLVAVLREEGHEVHVQNRLALQSARDISLDDLDRQTIDLLRDVDPDLVGISGATASFPDMRVLARLAKETVPSATVVLGGPHATVAPRETMERIPGADCLMVGEGERRLAQLAAGRPISELDGVVWRADNGEIQENPWREPEWELDGLPLPARDLLDMGWYATRDNRGLRGIPARCLTMLTSRGCPYRCAFCAEPAYTVRGVRFHGADRVVAEAETLLTRYPCDCLVFLDEMFTTDRDRVFSLTEAWQRRGLHERVTFAIQARADALDEEVLAALKRAGCLQIEIGVESGSDRMLARMRKGVTVEQNRRAVALTKAAGIRAQVNIMVGAPDETEEDLNASMALVEEMKPDALALLRFLPLPNTAFVRQLVEEGRLAPDFWATEERLCPRPVWDFTAMPPGRYDELYQRAWEKTRDINLESWVAHAPWWRTIRRRIGLSLRRRGIRRPGRSPARGRQQARRGAPPASR